MNSIQTSQLSSLYRASDIQNLWNSGKNLPIIDHPQLGKISPNQLRASFVGKPCPFCGKKMVQGKIAHSTKSKSEAIARGYQYKDANGNDYINNINSIYFHPNYITLDHKLNKARCPEAIRRPRCR